MNLNHLFLLFAQPQSQSGAEGQGGGGMVQMLIFFVLIIVVFYFFMIRPQKKKQQQMQNFRDALDKGDHIVTIGGIHGKIVSKDDATFTIEVADGVKLKIDKAAVAVDANTTSRKKEEK
jgi:preprotein translocase subunit YajC